jgi:hypothetical protein
MRALPALLLILPLAAGAQTSGSGNTYGGRQPWIEIATPLPQYPEPENYLPFEVNATTPFQFFVDAKSISVGADDVVRYSLIAKSPEGASNVSFEGMRCSTRQYRVYAIGRADKTWSEVRRSRWESIESTVDTVQRLVLFKDFFCPNLWSIASGEEGVQALRNGKNQRAVIQAY